MKIKRKKLNFTCILFTPALQKYLLISKSISQFPTKLNQKRKYTFHFCGLNCNKLLVLFCTVMTTYFVSQRMHKKCTLKYQNIKQCQSAKHPLQNITTVIKSLKLIPRFAIISRRMHNRKQARGPTFGK